MDRRREHGFENDRGLFGLLGRTYPVLMGGTYLEINLLVVLAINSNKFPSLKLASEGGNLLGSSIFARKFMRCKSTFVVLSASKVFVF